MAWPPQLEELKNDMKIELTDTRDDEALQRELNAAVSFVQRRRPKIRYHPSDPAQSGYPEPDDDLILGTLRFAARLDARRKSPDAMIIIPDMGGSRVSTGDPDIDRLLRIGRHQKARVG